LEATYCATNAGIGGGNSTRAVLATEAMFVSTNHCLPQAAGV
jgi:hypothetical protein